MRMRNDKKYQRQQDADWRNKHWQKLSFEDQLKSLDERDMTATRQRRVIQERIAKRK